MNTDGKITNEDLQRNKIEIFEHAIESAIVRLKNDKPDDRSELDRAYAITITEVEKAIAYFSVYSRRAIQKK